jgi:hypothetical protein
MLKDNDLERMISGPQNEAFSRALGIAFRRKIFVYGTVGIGSATANVARELAKIGMRAAVSRDNPGLSQGGQNTVIKAASIFKSKNPKKDPKDVLRKLSIYDPGVRVNTYAKSDEYTMMDLYYGQKDTIMGTLREDAIVALIHKAMNFKGSSSDYNSGREAYLATAGSKIEGWDSKSTIKYSGLTATKAISKIIRWGVRRFGGKILFEGKGVYYNQVFLKEPCKSPADTDLEAIELFKYFKKGENTAIFGDGKIMFYWDGVLTVPTQLHFLLNWKYSDSKLNLPGNCAIAGKYQAMNDDWKLVWVDDFGKVNSLRDIWSNFNQADPRWNVTDVGTLVSTVQGISKDTMAFDPETFR